MGITTMTCRTCGSRFETTDGGDDECLTCWHKRHPGAFDTGSGNLLSRVVVPPARVESDD